MAKDKLRKVLDKNLYENCLMVANLADFTYDEDVHFYIKFYETMVPKEKRELDDKPET